MLRRTRLIFTLALAFAFCPLAPPSSAQPSVERVTIDAHAESTPFPHFWEQMFGSGRAVLSMRQSYRDDIHAGGIEGGRGEATHRFQVCSLPRDPA